MDYKRIKNLLLYISMRLLDALPHRPIVVKNKYTIYPCKNVFYPCRFSITRFFIKCIDVRDGDKVLDMGCGTGILAIYCADRASTIVAVDISQEAVDCTRKNVAINGLMSVIDVRKGDLFSCIKEEEKFDLILFNPPLLTGEAKKKNDRRWIGGKTIIESFLSGAKNHLNEDGRIQLAYATSADFTEGEIEDVFATKGLSIERKCSKKGLFGKMIIYTLKNAS